MESHCRDSGEQTTTTTTTTKKKMEEKLRKILFKYSDIFCMEDWMEFPS
jgi:predicted MPP superfamily phosphohydrolase